MIYFLSDAHIGSKCFQDVEGHEALISELLLACATNAEEIYLLGDMLDFYCEFYHQAPCRHERFIHTLRLITSTGIPIHYFLGNHDMWTYGGLAEQTGVIIHKGSFETTIHGKKCFMAHGDAIIPSDYLQRFNAIKRREIKSFMFLQWIFHSTTCQSIFRTLPPTIGNALGYAWASKGRAKELKHPLEFLGEDQEALILYSRELERQIHHDYYIFGHRHIDINTPISPDSRVVILGELFRRFSYATMDEHGEITLQYLHS